MSPGIHLEGYMVSQLRRPQWKFYAL